MGRVVTVTLVGLVENLDTDTTIGEIVDDFALAQRAYWSELDYLMPDCMEKYTWGTAAGRIFDQYAIAFGLTAAAQREGLFNNQKLVDRLLEVAIRHLTYASETAEDGLPPNVYAKHKDFFEVVGG